MGNKKRLLSIILLLFTVGLFVAAIYVGNYLSQQATTPSDIEAGGGGAGSCCSAPLGCIAGYHCVGTSGCQRTATIGCGSKPYTSWRCQDDSTCYSDQGHKCGDKDRGTCTKDGGGGGGGCGSTVCEWPDIVVDQRNCAGGTCSCRKCNGIKGSDKCVANYTGCSGNPPTCNPPACPAGKVNCGTSATGGNGAGCQKMTNLSCGVSHPDCGNGSTIYRYCKDQVILATTIVPTTRVPPTTPVVPTTLVPTTPIITTPVVTTPVVTTPVVTTPVVTTPVVTTPVVTTPVVSTPVVTTPVITGTITITPPVSVSVTLPRTALTTDKGDRIIIGGVLALLGLLVFSVNWNQVVNFKKHVAQGKDIFEKNTLGDLEAKSEKKKKIVRRHVKTD